jgi:hypothetical protein
MPHDHNHILKEFENDIREMEKMDTPDRVIRFLGRLHG